MGGEWRGLRGISGNSFSSLINLSHAREGGCSFHIGFVHPEALGSSSPRGLPRSSLGTRSGTSHPAKQHFLQMCGECPQGLIPAPRPCRSQPVAYKDLCLTCLWERSVKGTDSRLGRCLPSIPTTHFPTIINRAGSYHQPKRGSASEVPRARWYLYPRHIGARSQRKGALACVVSTALPSSASLLPHRRAGRKKKNHPGGVFRGPQRLWGGPSSVCVAQRGCQPRHDLAVGGLAGGDESWAEGKAGRALAEIPVIWGFFGVVFFCFLGSCNVLAVSLWIWELILWLRGHHLGRAVLFFSPLFSGVDARSEQQKAAETQVDKRASPGTPSARFWGAPAGHGAPQPPGEHRQEALAPILGSGWRRTEEQHQRGAAPRGNKLHPLSASPHRGQAVPGGFCRATHPRGLRRF
ncbi:uncharacterized protein FYW23_013535 isoform 2-T2 [Sylvia borin]